MTDIKEITMKEYGGYIELERFCQPMLHEGAKALNCGRNCLAYLIQARNIKKLALPYFLCNSVRDVCLKENVLLRYYHISPDFKPVDFELQPDEWLYLVNYYGQLTNEYIEELHSENPRLIVDQAQAYFDMPAKGIDTLYTCRKYFGVADGAFLYTDAELDEELPLDESFDRMRFLLGRFERTASEFYSEYSANNHMFASEPIKKMSRLTDNLLHGIDYERIKKRRTDNFKAYSDKLSEINQLKLRVPEGAFAYPLLIENGAEIRHELQKLKAYIPTLWPNVMEDTEEDSLEYIYAKNILPLPVDQRYDENDIDTICEYILNMIKEK